MHNPNKFRKIALLIVQLVALTGWLQAGLLEISPAAAATAPGYRYFDYSRTDWDANPLWNGGLEVRIPANSPPFRPASLDKDTGQLYRPLIQPGQLVSLPDRSQQPGAIAVHDTATPSGDCSVAASARQLRSIQRYHALEAFSHLNWGPDKPDPRREQDNRGIPDGTFGDIGYHFLIDCAGHVFEGRAGGVFKRGRHVYRHNQGLIGVALIGDFAGSQPLAAQREALVRLLARLCRDFEIDPTGKFQQLRLDGSTTTLLRDGRPVLNIAGHNEFPDNDHTDPGILSMDRLRQDVTHRLAGGEGLLFSQTGQSLAEPFRTYWEANGASSIFGYPVSPVLLETSQEDGKQYRVQYYERTRFEVHPELAGTPYYISAGRLGWTAATQVQNLYPAAFQAGLPLPPGAASLYFHESGHRLQNGFLSFWQDYGGLAIFGLPLSEEFEQATTPGERYTVQYFERARFEYHPEAPTGFKVLLSRLGADSYANKVEDNKSLEK